MYRHLSDRELASALANMPATNLPPAQQERAKELMQEAARRFSRYFTQHNFRSYLLREE